jgi:hypothetical protein
MFTPCLLQVKGDKIKESRCYPAAEPTLPQGFDIALWLCLKRGLNMVEICL